MTDSILEACAGRVRAADKPLSVRQIREGLERAVRFPQRRAAEVRDLLEQRARNGEIHLWPGAGAGGPRFWGRGVNECLRELLLEALAERPLPLNPLLDAVQPRMQRLSRARVKAAAGAVLPLLAAEGLVRIEAVGRRPLYLSRDWAAKFARTEQAGGVREGGLEAGILSAVSELEPGAGNYVPVYRLRNADAVRVLFDRAVIALADAGQIVLSDYDGPRPVPRERVLDYVEDEQGRLYVAVARPRAPGVS